MRGSFVFVSFHHYSSCTIVLSNAIFTIIKIYSIILKNLKVSKTERLAEDRAECIVEN